MSRSVKNKEMNGKLLLPFKQVDVIAQRPQNNPRHSVWSCFLDCSRGRSHIKDSFKGDRSKDLLRFKNKSQWNFFQLELAELRRTARLERVTLFFVFSPSSFTTHFRPARPSCLLFLNQLAFLTGAW